MTTKIETYDASTAYFKSAADKAIPALRPGFDALYQAFEIVHEVGSSERADLVGPVHRIPHLEGRDGALGHRTGGLQRGGRDGDHSRGQVDGGPDDPVHGDGAEQFDSVPSGLRDEAVGELGAADPVREARVVVDPLGDSRLPAEATTVPEQPGVPSVEPLSAIRTLTGRSVACDSEARKRSRCTPGE